MLRFLPDDWLQALLRPFILAEPMAGIYVELHAPDWRFAFLTIFSLLAMLTALKRRRWPLTPVQTRLMSGFVLAFAAWTAISGNGRYFISGLLLVAPLLVLACKLLPGTTELRVAALILAAGVHLFAVQSFLVPGQWALARWYNGPALDIAASPLREAPAVFLTFTAISYSILVPRFHPQSRWANMAGQHDILPGTPEYPRFAALLQSPLPKYLVSPLVVSQMDAQLQPTGDIRQVLTRVLKERQLQTTGAACTVLPAKLSQGREEQPGDPRPTRGFWFCPVERVIAGDRTKGPTVLPASPYAEVLERVEQRCPRFFPPGRGVDTAHDGLWERHYTDSDTKLYVESSGRVVFRYFRALNPTVVGQVEQVRRGDFRLDCSSISGRYQLPWQRD